MLITAIVLILVNFAAMALFDTFPEWLFPAYRNFSKAVISVLSGLSDKLPFTLWEAGLVLLAAALVVTFLLMLIRKWKFLKWLGGVAMTISILFTMFTFFWGLDHYAPELWTEMDFTVQDSTREELLAATKYYQRMAEQYAEQMPRDENGLVCYDDYAALTVTAGSSLESLWEEYPIFIGSTVPVKTASLTGTILDYCGTTGIFVAMTGESTVNPNTYVCSLPHTMSHEVAHRTGIAGEDEANFAAFLGCISCDDPFFVYSGYYSAFLYCYNALYKVDPASALGLWTEEYELLRQDLRGASAHYAPYEGKVQDTAQKLNDTYLKSFSEEAGIQSYGDAADYLICWYCQKIANQ